LKNLAVFLVVFFELGCSSALLSRAGRVQKLDTIETLVLNKTARADVLNLLGAPDRKEVLSLKEEVWLYSEGPFKATRISLAFEDDKLQVVGWFVNEHDVESNFDNIKKRYGSANFRKQEGGWINSHAGPNEIYFSDDKLGLEIEYGKALKMVKSISWRVPIDQNKKNILDRQPAENFTL
jgi:hypothetical protein